jgi:hypothetical protein
MPNRQPACQRFTKRFKPCIACVARSQHMQVTTVSRQCCVMTSGHKDNTHAQHPPLPVTHLAFCSGLNPMRSPAISSPLGGRSPGLGASRGLKESTDRMRGKLLAADTRASTKSVAITCGKEGSHPEVRRWACMQVGNGKCDKSAKSKTGSQDNIGRAPLQHFVQSCSVLIHLFGSLAVS